MRHVTRSFEVPFKAVCGQDFAKLASMTGDNVSLKDFPRLLGAGDKEGGGMRRRRGKEACG